MVIEIIKNHTRKSVDYSIIFDKILEYREKWI